MKLTIEAETMDGIYEQMEDLVRKAAAPKLTVVPPPAAAAPTPPPAAAAPTPPPAAAAPTPPPADRPATAEEISVLTVLMGDLFVKDGDSRTRIDEVLIAHLNRPALAGVTVTQLNAITAAIQALL